MHAVFTQQRPNFAKLEEEVLKFWDEDKTFEKSVSKRFEDRKYVFYDGPPFATGLPHYGHIVASTTKDVMPRYWTMKGFRVERKWGWDCHGLPIENIIEKELDLKDKEAIENFGIENFNNACRNAVLRYANEWKVFIHRLGRWVDMENDYKTMDSWYMESLWWVFKQLFERDFIYRGHKAMHVCPRCSTPLSNFEVTQGYKDVKDIAVYVEFLVKDLPATLKEYQTDKKVYFIAWTTTPWTLPGNMLLAVQPEASYVLFTSEDPNNIYVVAKERLDSLIGEGTFTILKEIKGSELAGTTYEPLFPYYANTENAFRVVSADFVTLTEGSGVVHIAPAFGEDDYNVGKKENIPLVQHVGMDGKFVKEVTDFVGLSVKPKDNPIETDIKILKFLQEKDRVFKKENVTHSYPHCWRCDTPLINYATVSWFVKVTHFKNELLATNDAINWVPDHIKHGRFGKWLENARDWAISRNRYWGTPLPVWMSEDGDILCIGSKQELEELSGQKVDDLHKHVIDQITITKDGKTYTRIPEVLDCWFESGAMPYASFHYPFENKDTFESNFPAEFISEGQDQTRGWFYTLHVLATALTLGANPAIACERTTSSFKNVIVNGIVLAEDGKKMSKRLKNYPDPMDVVSKYGVDALRLYLMSSTVMKAENLNFSEKGVHEIQNKVVNMLWNLYGFYSLYVGKPIPEAPLQVQPDDHPLDTWLLSRIATVARYVTIEMDSYDVVDASRELIDFVNECSTWYLRLSRERIKENPRSGEVFGWTLITLCKLLAPFTPFITELIYQGLMDTKESIHLQKWPDVSALRDLENISLEAQMSLAAKVVERAHAIRKENGIKVRQPLRTLFVVSSQEKLPDEILEVVKAEVNVKQVEWTVQKEELMIAGQATIPAGARVVNPFAENISVNMDLNPTPELIAEGQMREAIRTIMDLRKKHPEVKVNQQVNAWLPEWPEQYIQEIKDKTLVKDLQKGEAKVELVS